MEEGVDMLLFNLLVLGSLQSQDGWIWCRSSLDLYLIETTPLMEKTQHGGKVRHINQFQMLEYGRIDRDLSVDYFTFFKDMQF